MDILLGIALSQHLNFQGEYNSIHPNVRIQSEQYIAGAFLNSESNISPYAGMRFEFDKNGFEIGIAAGYSYSEVVPYLRYTYTIDNMRLFMVPSIELSDDQSTLGAVIGIEYVFDK